MPSDFRILGPLEVLVDDHTVPLGGLKQRALLALLLLDAGRVVSTDRLVNALWGEDPPRTAVTSLQNFISQLRKLLGAESLETKSPGYRLDVAAGELDLDRFRALVEEARAAPADERSGQLREALGLWRGPALADFAFEAWATNEIGRLEEMRLAALEDRIEADLAAGCDAELVGELETLVAEHPLRERLRAQLMLALYRSGRQADALAAYQDGRRVLVDDLGIDPGPTLQQLYRAILRQESGLDAVPQAPAPEDHFEAVVNALLGGRLVAVLGADVRELAA